MVARFVSTRTLTSQVSTWSWEGNIQLRSNKTHLQTQSHRQRRGCRCRLRSSQLSSDEYCDKQ